MKYSDLVEGQTVFTDAGFDCMPTGPHKVYEDENGEFYIHCSHGHHNLLGQVDDESDIMVGIHSKEQ